MVMWEEKKFLIGAGVGASILVYYVIRRLRENSKNNDLIPIGTVKELYVYPVKSCKGISVFSFYCHPLGPVSGENFDRFFIVIDGKTGRFYTARQKPVMVTIECKVSDNTLLVRTKEGNSVTVDIDSVRKNNCLRTAM
ncbi:unnamed protein product [Strongylus vulgaris]|uniref:Molybdenum cofactor sulfurase middle domain-containing protein n=1 Tax=Strongylus vulgaris TaxID=40348 RepID=A0A3P7L1R7_STRVU|nr:unnamed protein product [Strongylus vulgaris]